VQERGEPHGEACVRVGGRLDDAEDVVVERGVELWEERGEDARLTCEPERSRGLPAEQKPRQFVAEPLTRDEADIAGLLLHLPKRRLVGRQPALGDETQTANEAERVLGEAARPDGPQHPVAEILLSVEGVDELVGLETARDRVTVKSRRAMSSSIDSAGSATISKS
jgi:hypothetical protein